MSLGAQLQKYRALAGLQYKELADLSGVDIGTINALEKRKSKRSEHAPALAKALGLSMEELLDTEADHSGQVLAHMARHRSQQGGTDAAKLLREGAASYRLTDTTHITRLNPEQLRAMLTPSVSPGAPAPSAAPPSRALSPLERPQAPRTSGKPLRGHSPAHRSPDT